MGHECCAIHCAVDDKGRCQAIDAQRGDRRQGFPVAVRDARNKALATRSATRIANHLGRHRRLIDEDELWRAQGPLLGFQLSPGGGDIRAILLGGVQRFF